MHEPWDAMMTSPVVQSSCGACVVSFVGEGFDPSSHTHMAIGATTLRVLNHVEPGTFLCNWEGKERGRATVLFVGLPKLKKWFPFKRFTMHFPECVAKGSRLSLGVWG